MNSQGPMKPLQGCGWIEVIVGGMFSGKTEELIRRLKRSEWARQKIQVFKPSIDNRYHEQNVTSHDQNSMSATPLSSSEDLWLHLDDDTQVVGIDEGQFFDSNLVKVCQDLAERGLRVIVAGLDLDWKAQPFEPMPTLMAIAENVTKQQAICIICGKAASRSQRLAGGESKIAVGAKDLYEARCREHFRPEILKFTEPNLEFLPE